MKEENKLHFLINFMIDSFCALSNNNDKKLMFLSKFNHIIFHDKYEIIFGTFCVNNMARKPLNTTEKLYYIG